MGLLVEDEGPGPAPRPRLQVAQALDLVVHGSHKRSLKARREAAHVKDEGSAVHGEVVPLLQGPLLGHSLLPEQVEVPDHLQAGLYGALDVLAAAPGLLLQKGDVDGSVLPLGRSCVEDGGEA